MLRTRLEAPPCILPPTLVTWIVSSCSSTTEPALTHLTCSSTHPYSAHARWDTLKLWTTWFWVSEPYIFSPPSLDHRRFFETISSKIEFKQQPHVSGGLSCKKWAFELFRVYYHLFANCHVKEPRICPVLVLDACLSSSWDWPLVRPRQNGLTYIPIQHRSTLFNSTC